MSNDKQLSEAHAKVRAILTHHGVSLNGALEADLIHELLPAYVLRTAASEPSKYSDLVSDGGMDMRDRLAQQASAVGAIHIKNTEQRIAECSNDDRVNTVQLSVAKFYSMLCEIDELRAALAQQASEPVLVQGCHRSHPHENMQDICFDAWEKTMNYHIKQCEPAQVSQPVYGYLHSEGNESGACGIPNETEMVFQHESKREVYIAPPDYEALKAENARLQREIKWLINECFESGVSVRVRNVIAEIEKELK